MKRPSPHRIGLLAGCSLFASSPLLAQTGAQADTAATSAPIVEDIVVTAQKREESLQDTPISIAVLGGQALEDRGISSLGDFLSGAVPALRIVPTAGTRTSAFSVSMRGISSGDPSQISRDPSVGIYVDGVYLGRVQGLGTEMFDIERIEVLRGPQGTLFGRNAVGGALSIVSKKPTGRFGVDLVAGIRNYDGRNVRAHVNLPEFAGISIKLDGILSKRGGWVDNPLAGESDWHAYNRRGGRVSALWQPSDEIDVLYSFDKSRDASVVGYTQIFGLVAGAPALPPIFSTEPDRVKRGRAGVPLDPGVAKVEGHSLNASWNFTDGLTLRSISAYRKLKQSQFDQAGGLLQAFSPNGLFARLSLSDVEQDQFSQELQLIGSLERVNFVLGGFYFEEDASDSAFAPFVAQFNATGTAYTILPTPFSRTPPPDRGSEAHARSKALFGQATFTPSILDDRLHLTGGLRWTHDRKHGALTTLRGTATNIGFQFESKRLDPAATVAFDWNDDINTYVRWGTAYRAGGAQSRSVTFRPFNEEEVESWEVGFKADLFDRRARVNIAAFRTRYRDRQVEFVNPANPSNLETLNADSTTKIHGVEVDVTVVPARGLTLSGSYSYTDGEVGRDVNPFTGARRDGGGLNDPKHSAVAAIDYNFKPFSFGTVSAHVDAIYSSSFVSADENYPTGSYFLLNGRVTLGDIRMGGGDNEFAISLWTKNLTNKQYRIFQFPYEGTGLAGNIAGAYNEPRTYGLEARLAF